MKFKLNHLSNGKHEIHLYDLTFEEYSACVDMINNLFYILYGAGSGLKNKWVFDKYENTKNCDKL